MDSDDAAPLALEQALPSEPVHDHPLQRMFERDDAPAGERTPKPPVSGTSTPRPGALAQATTQAATPAPAPPATPAAATPNRAERPAGGGFAGLGSTPFRFGVGSRAQATPVAKDAPPADAASEGSPRDTLGAPAPSLVTHSTSLAAIGEATQDEAPSPPGTSPNGASDGMAPSLSQSSTSPELDADEIDSPRQSPALRRVGRMPQSMPRSASQRPLRLVSSSSSLGWETQSKTRDDARRTEATKAPDAPSFLGEPYSGFRPQGIMSRTRSRSGGAADLRSRPAASHHASQSFTGRTRLAPLQILSRVSDAPPKSSVSMDGTLPTSSLSFLPKDELGTDKAHRRKQHGGSDPTLLKTPLLSLPKPGVRGHAREASEPVAVSEVPQRLAPLPPRTAPQTPDSKSTPDPPKDVFQTSPAPPAHAPFEGPALRPLDLANLMNRQELHTELTQTVNDLGAWLDALALGLSTVLAPSPLYHKSPRGT